jgi:hypothetical protein
MLPVFPVVSLAASPEELEVKLEECQSAYSRSRDLKASQEDSAQAAAEYRTLLIGILEDLNAQNKVAADAGSMTPERLTHSVMVMGAVLEMMADPPQPDPYWTGEP